MIVYSLQCANSHAFEGWFASSSAYDEQEASGKLVCPVCSSPKVTKAPMAPAVSGTKKSTLKADELKKMRQFLTGMRKYVTENADYVGKEFAEEARKIHYGETEERQIYGEASLEEAKALVEEGVEIAALPPDLEEEAN
ncbi:hypothetical protein FHS83_003323 [Rhizomicrobium palustre]|uniref:DUF1178 domain-containing protein n=1 Tax=Rhizomicrobium palustre TaxID=189966 RepID=A0A846N3F4_9PROT|nr:DUF1178 family protein [Rhizomicrobium palustre]NIK90005.1 hypothetical protein [Rhizomicrobium palustre]